MIPWLSKSWCVFSITVFSQSWVWILLQHLHIWQLVGGVIVIWVCIFSFIVLFSDFISCLPWCKFTIWGFYGLRQNRICLFGTNGNLSDILLYSSKRRNIKSKYQICIKSFIQAFFTESSGGVYPNTCTFNHSSVYFTSMYICRLRKDRRGKSDVSFPVLFLNCWSSKLF